MPLKRRLKKFQGLLVGCSWFAAPIILWVSFCGSWTSAYGQSFEFNVGDEIKVHSDKGYRRTKDNTLEAVGNVIITHDTDAVYGEKASLSFDSGESEVVGNVRYIGPLMTMYGAKLNYNFKTSYLAASNARLISERFVVVGSFIEKVAPRIVKAKEAEYSTCKDCPESWSIFGHEVTIYLGEYIHIKHAYLKINGVVAMYVPYVVFPIKKNRETGLLFPTFGVNFENGILFQQPWFWNISDSTDMTLAPALWGQRGYFNEFQYRQAFSEKSFVELNSIQALDRIYVPNQVSFERQNSATFRGTTTYEHHYGPNWSFNHHLNLMGLGDLDMVGDYEKYFDQRLEGPYYTSEGFFDWRFPQVNLSLEGGVQRNLLFDNGKGFDHEFVQILPRIRIGMAPVSVYQSDTFFLNNIYFNFDGDFTEFRQDHNFDQAYEDEALAKNRQRFFREARRIDLRPSLKWDLGRLGPVNFLTSANFDYQAYQFPVDGEGSFVKEGIRYESEIFFEIEKIFGLAYKGKYPLARSEIDSIEKGTYDGDAAVLAPLPELSKSFTVDHVDVVKSSYRHSQIFKLKHYYFSNQKGRGNTKFLAQIKDPSPFYFDGRDVFRDDEYLQSTTSAVTSLPVKNTFELQWNHSLVKKTPTNYRPFKNYLGPNDNFSFSETAYLNIAQAYDTVGNPQANRGPGMARTLIQGGLGIGDFSVNFEEIYIPRESKHVFTGGLGYRSALFDVSFNGVYNSVNDDRVKTVAVSTKVRPIDLIELGLRTDYNLEKSEVTTADAFVMLNPANNCWKLRINYTPDDEDNKISFNVYFNFDGERFVGLNE